MLKAEFPKNKFVKIQARTQMDFTVELLSSYDIDIDLGKGRHVEIGRFSASALRAARIYAKENQPGLLLKVGSLCEFGYETVLLVGGNHSNDKLFNYTFGNSRILSASIRQEDRDKTIEDYKGIFISDNVIVSYRNLVLDGANIGPGSVIGAGSLVRGPCEANTIYGGVPAKPIRRRLPEHLFQMLLRTNMSNVRAADVAKLPHLLHLLEVSSISEENYAQQVEFLNHRPKVYLEASVNAADNTIGINKVKTFSVGDEFINERSANNKLKIYFEQILSKKAELEWTPDIFEMAGIY